MTPFAVKQQAGTGSSVIYHCLGLSGNSLGRRTYAAK